MDMHKKIIAFAISLETNELNSNRLILLTNAGLLSALPVYSDESDIQPKLLYQCLKSTKKHLTKIMFQLLKGICYLMKIHYY